MKSKQNTAQKYLTTKRSSVLDLVFALFIGIGALLFLFSWLYYAIIALLIGCIGLICTKASKIKDDEFEDVLKIILRDKGPETTGDCKLELYDLGKGPVTLAKDKKPKSGFWVITEFSFKEGVCDIVKYEADIINSKVSEERCSVSLPASVSVEDIYVNTYGGRRKMSYIVLNGGEMKIPADTTSIDTDEIIQRLGK